MPRLAIICSFGFVLLLSMGNGHAGHPADVRDGPACPSDAYESVSTSTSGGAEQWTPPDASRWDTGRTPSVADTTMVYSSTNGEYLLSPGAPYTPIADDIWLAADCGCDLVLYSIAVHGGGDGTGTFSAWLSLWDDCPSGGGHLIPYTARSFSDLQDNVTIELPIDISSAPVAIPPIVWLRAEFSTPTAGVIAGAPPELGRSLDTYDALPDGCSSDISIDEYAAFYAQLSCLPTPPPAEPGGPDPTDGAEHVTANVRLSWDGGANLVSRPIYGPEAIVAALPSEEWAPKARQIRESRGEDVGWCATQEIFEAQKHTVVAAVEDECPGYGLCDLPEVRELFTPTGRDPIKTFRMVIHVFCDDLGELCATTSAVVDAQVGTLNDTYRPWRMQFVHETDFIFDSRFRYYEMEEDAQMKHTYADSPESKLNVYVVTTSGFSHAFMGFLPLARIPLGGVVMNASHFSATGTVLTHEVGHALGLWHTFHGVSEVEMCSVCYEEAGAANRDETGDRCSDTDPTPLNFLCGPPGGTDPCSGNAWGGTPFRNHMGYGTCRTEFTSQQAGRAHCWTEYLLSPWLTGPCESESTFDVLLGTEDPPTEAVCEDAVAPYCDVRSLDCDTTYHWQVVAENPPSSGGSTAGPVWSFTTDGGVPEAPVDPQPVDGSLGVSVTTDLTWNGGGRVLDGELLFGAVSLGWDAWPANVLYTIDPGTSTAVELTGVFVPSVIAEVEWSPDGDVLYAAMDNWPMLGGIDANTGLVVTATGYKGSTLDGLEFDSTGTLLATSVSGAAGASSLGRVNLTTRELEPIGPTGLGKIGGLAFDATFSTLYGITSGGAVPPLLLSIDPQTGAATSIGSTGLEVPTSSLEFTIDGRLITGAADGILYELDVDTGHATPIGDMGIGAVSGLSARVAAPEPCTPLYDVYIGATTPPETPVCTDLSTPRCDLGILDLGTTYYWQVIAHSRFMGASTPGPVWSFTTPPPTPTTPIPDPQGSHVAKNRYISMVIPEGMGQDTAIRLTLTSLHHLASPPDVPDFTAWEGTTRWVNSLTEDHTCPDSPVFGTTFGCAVLGCEPEYRDWATELGGEVLHVTGAAVVPSSQYDVAQLPSHCRGIENSCTAISDELPIFTAKFGNVDDDPQLNVLDTAEVVDHLKGIEGSLPKPRVHLRANVPDALGETVTVLDAATVVDALKDRPYGFAGDFGPCTDECPGEDPCP